MPVHEVCVTESVFLTQNENGASLAQSLTKKFSLLFCL